MSRLLALVMIALLFFAGATAVSMSLDSAEQGELDSSQADQFANIYASIFELAPAILLVFVVGIVFASISAFS